MLIYMHKKVTNDQNTLVLIRDDDVVELLNFLSHFCFKTKSGNLYIYIHRRD